MPPWPTSAHADAATLAPEAKERPQQESGYDGDLVIAAGSETAPTDTAETRSRMATETAMWAKVVKSASIRIE
jgi:hypothetical protein